MLKELQKKENVELTFKRNLGISRVKIKCIDIKTGGYFSYWVEI